MLQRWVLVVPPLSLLTHSLAGSILNAHDGSVVNFGGTYHMYGTVYEDCHQNGTQCHAPCGYSPNQVRRCGSCSCSLRG